MNKQSEKKLRKEKGLSIGLSLLGIGTLILAILDIHQGLMAGLTTGFLTGGISSWYSLNRVEKNEKLAKAYQASQDERNIFVRLKAAYFSFWSSFVFISLLTIVSNVVEFSFVTGGVLAIFFMSGMYFGALWHYLQRF